MFPCLPSLENRTNIDFLTSLDKYALPTKDDCMLLIFITKLFRNVVSTHVIKYIEFKCDEMTRKWYVGLRLPLMQVNLDDVSRVSTDLKSTELYMAE